jgi:predicted deacetylase
VLIVEKLNVIKLILYRCLIDQSHRMINVTSYLKNIITIENESIITMQNFIIFHYREGLSYRKDTRYKNVKIAKKIQLQNFIRNI